MSGSDREKWNRRYLQGAYADRTHPSALLEQWLSVIPRGRALDIACGAGRNALYLAARGFEVEAVDISSAALQRGAGDAAALGLDVTWREHDLDTRLPLEAEYALILMIRYVNLPLLTELCGRLAPGGFLVCEEHLLTSADVVGPANPTYRVAPGQLAAAARGLTIHFLEEGLLTQPDGALACTARLVGQRPALEI